MVTQQQDPCRVRSETAAPGSEAAITLLNLPQLPSGVLGVAHSPRVLPVLPCAPTGQPRQSLAQVDTSVAPGWIHNPGYSCEGFFLLQKLYSVMYKMFCYCGSSSRSDCCSSSSSPLCFSNFAMSSEKQQQAALRLQVQGPRAATKNPFAYRGSACRQPLC